MLCRIVESLWEMLLRLSAWGGNSLQFFERFGHETVVSKVSSKIGKFLAKKESCHAHRSRPVACRERRIRFAQKPKPEPSENCQKSQEQQWLGATWVFVRRSYCHKENFPKVINRLCEAIQKKYRNCWKISNAPT